MMKVNAAHFDACSYLTLARDSLLASTHVEAPMDAYWHNQAIAKLRGAANVLGFDLVPRAAEKLDDTEDSDGDYFSAESRAEREWDAQREEAV